jgi:GDPmannose 4,6-dehydratase
MRFLITGAGGQDGQYLVKSLSKSGHEVIEIGREYSKFYQSGQLVEARSPRLVDPTISAEFLESQKPDCILHFAAVHYPAMIQDGDSNREEMFACHVTTTENLLQWMTKNLDSKMIVALSSQMFSSENENVRISEETHHNPATFYGQTKAEAHRLIRRYAVNYQTNAAGAILFNHTSTRSKSNFLFPILAKAISESISSGYKDITVRNSNAYLDLGSSDEYCDGIISMVSQERLTDYIFSSGSALTIASIVNGTLFELGHQGKINLLTESHETRWCPVGDNSKARERLSWSPTKSSAQILAEMVNHIQVN